MLLEVVIAMALVSVLMAMLMGYYGQLELIHHEIDEAQDESFQLRYLQTRLAYVLPRIIPVKGCPAEPEKIKDFYFYTSNAESMYVRPPSLVFTFDNGIDLDPRFSNYVLARLLIEYVGSEQRLVLLMWPVPRCWRKDGLPPMKKEILIDKIADVDFDFFLPAEPDNKAVVQIRGVGSKPIPEEERVETNQWHSSWNIAYQDLPAIIKIKIQRTVPTGLTPAGEWIEMAFPIPNSRKPIVIAR